jgi:hypothetical protein
LVTHEDAFRGYINQLTNIVSYLTNYTLLNSLHLGTNENAIPGNAIYNS